MKMMFIVTRETLSSDEFTPEVFVEAVLSSREKADAFAERMNEYHRTASTRPRTRYVVEEMEVDKLPEMGPKFVHLTVPLEKDNTLGRVASYPCSGPKKGVEFRPLKDNEFSFETKGGFSAVVPYAEGISNEELKKGFLESISVDELVPEWVLKSKDGHDPEYPQGH